MSDVTINYKGSSIATMDASGTKTLLTEGKYCEDDIEVVYVKPSGGGVDLSGIKQAVSLNNIGGLFTQIKNASGWAYLEYSCTSGTNPMTVNFGRAIKGLLIYPKSKTVTDELIGEQVVLAVSQWNDADADGNQTLRWGMCRFRTNTTNGFMNRLNGSTPYTFTNGVLSMIPAFPSNQNYHPFGFNVPYIFVYWW